MRGFPILRRQYTRQRKGWLPGRPIRLSAWTVWRLVDYEIVCVECKRLQPLSDADSEFEHQPGCIAGPRTSAMPSGTVVS